MNLFKRILTVISIILIALSIIVIVIYATALSSETGDFPLLDDYVVSSKVPERPAKNSKFIYESYDESKYNYASSSVIKTEEASEPKATIFLSCPTNMEVGSSIVVTVSTTNLKGEYSLQISGTNLVDGYFVEGDEILFYANKNGSATIYACSNYDPSIVSNKITISVTGNAIASADDLSKLRGSSSNYILVDDIDMSTFSTWEPIEGFTGTLDGKGHSIFNLTMVGKEEQSSLGFFKDFSGTLKNISFENINIKTASNSKNIGIVAGVIKGGKVEDVTVDGLVDTPYSESVGSFFGKYENGDILNCINYAKVSAKSVVGGIVGELPINDLGSFTGNINYGTVSSSEEKVGGIVGYVYATEPSKGTSEKLFSGNKNEGEIQGAGNVGGIAGSIEGYYKYKPYDGTYSLKINVLNCLNTGKVISSGDYIGGIVGYGNNMGSFKGCDNRGDITGINWVGGFVGKTDAIVYANGFSNESSITGYAYIGGVAGESGGINGASNVGNVITIGSRLEDGIKVSNVGGVVGFCKGSIENCSNLKEIKSTSGGSNVGGVAGAVECNTSTKINENFNTCNISSNGENTGGIFGMVYAGEPSKGTYEVELIGLDNKGNVNGTKNVGGVVGKIEGFYKYKQYDGTYSLKINVSNSSNVGKITALGDYAGGIIGYSGNMGSFKRCFNEGDITGVNWVGGIVGRTNATVYANGFSNESSITGYAYVGGIAGECGGVSDALNDGNVITLGSRLEDGVKVSNVGGIVGLCRGSIENCNNLKEVKSTSGGSCVGGVAGTLECDTSAKIDGNSNTGNVSSNGESTGGVFGKVYASEPYERGTYEIELVGMNNSGSVNGTKNVGGIAGTIEGYYKYKQYDGTYSLKISLSNCINIGKVISSGDYSGGIVGYGDNMGSFKECSNGGDLTGKNWVGGFVGRTDAMVYAVGFANKNTVIGYAYVGGIAGECGGVSDASNDGNVITLGSRLEDGVKVSNVGGVVGFCKGSVENCSNSREIDASTEGSNVGGVVGIVECNTGTKLTGNSNAGEISSRGDFTGGLFGRVYASEPSERGTYAIELVGMNNSGSVNGSKNVGGIAGTIEGYYKYKQYDGTYSLRINLSNCFNIGKVMSSGDYAGGVVGYGNNTDSFKDCSNGGDVIGVNWVGGVVGRTDAMVYANDFSNKNSITGYAYVGGIAGECGGISDASNYGNVVTIGSRIEDGVKVSNVGGVVGLCRGSIENCSNFKEIKSTSGGSNVGGVAGSLECNTSSKVNRNSNTGNVSSNGENTGGVFGMVYTREPSERGTYEVALVEANNKGNVNGVKNVGGIAGIIEGYYKYKQYDGTYSLEISVFNCSNTGGIVAHNENQGSIVGLLGNQAEIL